MREDRASGDGVDRAAVGPSRSGRPVYRPSGRCPDVGMMDSEAPDFCQKISCGCCTLGTTVAFCFDQALKRG